MAVPQGRGNSPALDVEAPRTGGRLVIFWVGLLLALSGAVGGKAWLRNRFQSEIAAIDQKRAAVVMPLNQIASNMFPKLVSGGSIDLARRELLKIGPNVKESHSPSMTPGGGEVTFLEAIDPKTGYRVEVTFVGSSFVSMSRGIPTVPSFDQSLWDWMIALALIIIVTSSLDPAPGGLFLRLSKHRMSWVGVALLLGSIALAVKWMKSESAAARSRCRKCKYDLTGNESGICPECGTAIRMSLFSPEDVAQRLSEMQARGVER